jgi:hypothetical protein
MKVGHNNRYAYNAQAVADEKEKIIVACEATRQETDHGQLVAMMEQVRQNLGAAATAQTVTVADTAYGSGADLQAAHDKGFEVLAPSPEGKPAKGNPYATQHFKVDPLTRTVVCPQGRQLAHEGQTTKGGQIVQRYRCQYRDCPVRAQCTRDPKGRQLEVWPHHAAVEAVRRKLEQPGIRALWKQRAEIIEPRFAQLKQHDGFRRWTVWGLEAVRTQWSLLCATLNLRILYRRWRIKVQARFDQAAIAVGQIWAGLRVLTGMSSAGRADFPACAA